MRDRGAGSLVTGDPLNWVRHRVLQRPEPGFLCNLDAIRSRGQTSTTPILPSPSELRFSPGESAAIDFRAEFFNLFSRTNFDLPDAERMEAFDEDVERADFARITNVRQSREIQLAIKLTF